MLSPFDRGEGCETFEIQSHFTSALDSSAMSSTVDSLRNTVFASDPEGPRCTLTGVIEALQPLANISVALSAVT